MSATNTSDLPDPLFTEASEADELELTDLLASEDVDGDNASDQFFDDLEDEIEALLAELETDPTQLARAQGESLWVGFDAEWVYDEERRQNRILSIQLYVPPQPALSKDEKKQAQIAGLSRLILASGPNRADRPELLGALRQLVDQALTLRLIEAEPQLIYVVGFALRFDLGALRDFGVLKQQVDGVSGKVATVKGQAQLEYDRALMTGDGFTPIMIGLHFIDVAAHVPPGKALRDIGDLIQLPKLEIPKPYSIERMDEYLKADPEGFRAYAMRDAEIAVIYAMRLANFAREELNIRTLPATASGLALRWYLNTLKEEGVDRLEAFGLQKTVKEAYHAGSKRRRTYKDEEPTPMRLIHDALTTETYAGGRNEAMWIGPTAVGHWTDYDLAGAYSTGLMDLPLIDFDHPRATTRVEDYLGHVAGYALIDFEHAPDTRFPVFAISRGGKGLIFPLKGRCYATAPEIRAAHDLGCQINIKWGIIYAWKVAGGEVGADGVPKTRLFGTFIKAARVLRKKLKDKLDLENADRASKGLPPVDSLEEQAAKLYVNSAYGKVCQSIRPKTVFDTRKISSTRLKPSPITNPAIGAHVTGFIRAILAEILNKLPRDRTVVSCTTDGFLTDATEDEVFACLNGDLCKRFQTLCEEIVPGSRMLEVKHEVAQIVCMKTRGQLTGRAFPDSEIRRDTANGKKTRKDKIVLAKAGVQPIVEAKPSLPAEAYKRLQNEKMLNLYLDRRPGKKILLRQFPSIRDQWENGVDLHKYARRIMLSLEPDLKREPMAPEMRTVDVAGRPRAHISLNTRPWQTVADFDAARAKLDQWRRSHTLKTLEDWQDLSVSLAVNANRTRLRAKGAVTLNMRAGKDESDLLRRAFLRAYTHDEEWAMGRPMPYKELAAWLTTIGYPTTAKEVMSARSQRLALHVVPRTEVAMRLWRQLQERFADADLGPLLADSDSV